MIEFLTKIISNISYDDLIPIAAAVIPAFLLSFYVYWRDHHEPEPKHYLIICFIFGMVSTVPAIFLELYGHSLGYNISYDIWITFVYAFGVVGFSEELVKFVFLRFYIYPKEEFCEPMDGIVYSVMVSMGFAALENILYVLGGGLNLALVRAFTAVPAHAAFAIAMGYFVGLAKFDPKREKWLLFLGLFSATVMHGAYDFFIFQQNFPALATLTFVVLIGSLILGLGLIRKHVDNSPHRLMANKEDDGLFEDLNE